MSARCHVCAPAWLHALEPSACAPGVLDDCSRLCCHAQCYLEQDTEALVHALLQAIFKRGLPRALMSNNGSAMTSAQTTEGPSRLSTLHHTTLPYSPEQASRSRSGAASNRDRSPCSKASLSCPCAS
jgi:hypothetical protein